MKKFLQDISGKTFNKLTVLRLSHIDKSKDYKAFYVCKCVCGKEIIVLGNSLKTGNTKSCGCIKARVPVKCDRCGKIILKQKTRVNKKENFCNWSCRRNIGGVFVDKHGYRIIILKDCKMKEHRLFMEKKIGRKLLSTEIVHHINGNKQDNRIENLEITTRTEHSRFHHKGLSKKTKATRVGTVANFSFQ